MLVLLKEFKENSLILTIGLDGCISFEALYTTFNLVWLAFEECCWVHLMACLQLISSFISHNSVCVCVVEISNEKITLLTHWRRCHGVPISQLLSYAKDTRLYATAAARLVHN